MVKLLWQTKLLLHSSKIEDNSHLTKEMEADEMPIMDQGDLVVEVNLPLRVAKVEDKDSKIVPVCVLLICRISTKLSSTIRQ